MIDSLLSEENKMNITNIWQKWVLWDSWCPKNTMVPAVQ
jgi:hypothetical protein